MNADEAVSNYFKAHRSDIDAITGSALVVPLAKEVETGDAEGIMSLFRRDLKNERYPGLRRSDMPCFWVEDGEQRHEIIRLPNNLDDLNTYLRAMTDAAAESKSPKEIKEMVMKTAGANATERSPWLKAFLGGLPVSKSYEKIVALVCGVIFVTAILVLAIFIPAPSPFQYLIFRVVLSLASAGFVSMTPGFLDVKIANWVRAGGALAVFVLVFFYNPASLIVPHLPGT